MLSERSERRDYSLGAGGESCADLKDQGASFSVKVGVGTPPQYFELIADTGSNAVVVTDCVCLEDGGCPLKGPCFQGTNKSATFALDKGPKGSVEIVSLTYGSGTVQTVIGTDVVQVGKASALMKNGVLLLVDRRQLRISGQFEGIVGMGPPSIKQKPSGPHIPAAIKKWLPKLYHAKLFMEQAGVSRYTLCFNDDGRPGALRLDAPPFANPLPSVGQFHWAVSLQGMSAGKASAPALFCGKADPTSCAGIPDSGTTDIMGPKDQIVKLFAGLCDAWPRCKKARSPFGGKLRHMSKSHAFQTLLHDCGSWMIDKKGSIGLREVPSIFLKVGGPDKEQTLELTAWAYVVESTPEELQVAVKHLKGVAPKIVVKPVKEKPVCMPSFGVMAPAPGGPKSSWIFGGPFFYQFTIGYDLKGRSVSFQNGKCKTCSASQKPSFLDSQQRQIKDQRFLRPRRRFHGEPRTPSFDPSIPL